MAALEHSWNRPSKKMLPSAELIEDLCCRFILNIPNEDQESFSRIMFNVEQAHWSYEDIYIQKNPTLASLSLKEFTRLAFENCPALNVYLPHVNEIFDNFIVYKHHVPVSGAIILNKYCTKFLLVKGWKEGSSWSFPRGKKNKDEEDYSCAIREVMEETGYNISKLLKKDDYVEILGQYQQRIRLYIISGVEENTTFTPLTQKEISAISWFQIDDFTTLGDKINSKGPNGMKHYMVIPFLAQLNKWRTARRLNVPFQRSAEPTRAKWTPCRYVGSEKDNWRTGRLAR